MLAKLEILKEKWEEVGKLITDPEVITDQKRYVKLTREYNDLKKIVDVYHVYKNTIENLESAKEVLAIEKDEEFREMAKLEFDECTTKKAELEEEIKFLLIPQDPEDNKNAVVELRAGTGGDEASIFCGDLFRMYTKYCETRGWKTEVVDVNHGTSGGYKEVVFEVKGPQAYGLMKYESGVHRVQRVPQTETQGRVHTSAATVAVLPEADEFDIDLKTSDIRKDTYCASGPGGQSVNTTYSAVRVTHIPTGIVAQCQDQKSQIKNYEKAMKVLRSRIYEIEHQKHLDEIAGKRKTMVSSGDRSAKIRTYNYAQGRVTDHRINLTLYNLAKIIDGDLTEITEALQIAENTEKLKETEQH